jgi:hypothetical protein
MILWYDSPRGFHLPHHACPRRDEIAFVAAKHGVIDALRFSLRAQCESHADSAKTLWCLRLTSKATV